MTLPTDNPLTAPQVADLCRYYGQHYGAGEVEPPVGVEHRPLSDVDLNTGKRTPPNRDAQAASGDSPGAGRTDKE